jgi:hypothetical protein
MSLIESNKKKNNDFVSVYISILTLRKEQTIKSNYFSPYFQSNLQKTLEKNDGNSEIKKYISLLPGLHPKLFLFFFNRLSLITT